MKNSIHKLLFLLLFAAYSINTFAQSFLPEAVVTNIKARVDNGTNQAIVVAVIDADGPHYFSYGVKSLKTKEPVNEYSVFEIGSISKVFTGILLADRVLKGDMKLDDPLQKYLPEGVKSPVRNGASIQLVNMSNHTSSLPRMPGNFTPANPANPFADYTEKQMWDYLNGYELTRDIGSQYEYSNYAQGILGHVLASQKKTTYEKLMVDLIADPLKMNDTRITLTPRMKTNLAFGHSAGAQVENWDIPTLAGAGAIRSTAVDMVTFISANMGKTKTKLFPAMQLSHQNTRPEGSTPMVALGWHKVITPDVEVIWHNGGTGGYRTFAGFTKAGDKGVVVLSNSDVSIDDIGFHLLNPKSPLKEIPKEISVPEEVLQRYVGKYALSAAFVLTVTRDGSQLKVQATGQAELPVYPKATNVFFWKAVEAQITFNEKDGKIESATMKQGGREIIGPRMPD
ncbi:MAG: serine hydrolase [Bacteroidota bacterium]